MKLSRVALIVAVPVVLLVTRHSPAGYAPAMYHTTVEIEGQDFGIFANVEGQDKTATIRDQNGHTFRRIMLERTFVTKPAMSSWAQKRTGQIRNLTDVHIIVRDKGEVEIIRYILRSSQPLSWTVAEADPAGGGFKERVEIAVQEIEMIRSF